MTDENAKRRLHTETEVQNKNPRTTKSSNYTKQDVFLAYCDNVCLVIVF